MPSWGKTEEQKQAEREAKAAQEWAESPVGRATAAKEAGQAFFQFEMDISALGGSSGLGSSAGRMRHSGGRPDLLGQIEETGWRLEHVGYVFIETGATTTNRVMSTGQGTVTKGVVRGIYLFRNTV
jgi:hypothetical protein